MKRLALLCILFARGALAQFDATEMCFASAADMVPLSTAGGCATWTDLGTAIEDEQFWTRAGSDLSPTNVGDTVTVNPSSGATGDLIVKGDTATSLLVVDASADSVEVGDTTQGDLLKIQPTGTVFNEDGSDRDWRLEVPSNANMISVDAGLGTLALATTPVATQYFKVDPLGFNVGASNGRIMAIQGSIESTSAAAGIGILQIQGALRPAASPMSVCYGVIALPVIAPAGGSGGVSHNITTLYSYYNRIDMGDGYTGTVTTGVNFQVDNPVLGSGPGVITNLIGVRTGALTRGANQNVGLRVQRPSGGAVLNRAIWTDGGDVVINDLGNADSLWVESDTNANMFFVDGVNNRVGIGTGSPTSPYELEVFGSEFINGQADETQLTVQGNGTQTSTIMEVESSAGADYLTVHGDGRVSGTALHNVGTVTGTANQFIASGTWTATLTGVANVAASTAYQGQWMRVGNVVTASLKVDVDPTLTATSTQLGISLPIASNLVDAQDCAGTAFASGIAGQGAAILADGTNDRCQMQWVSTDVTNQPMYIQFTYEVL